MNAHPEQQAGEIYLGNFTPGDLLRVGWKTTRTGEKAYCRDGTPYPFQKQHGVRPAFIRRDEIEQAIEAELAAGDPCGRVPTYLRLLAV